MFSVYLVPGCKNGSTQEDSVDSAIAINDSSRNATDSTLNQAALKKDSMVVDKNSSDFVVNAASGGMMEVKLGKIAEKKAVSERVRNFAKMIVRDHTIANRDLKSRANSEKITLPASISNDQQKMIDDIDKKTGKAFDKAFISMMVKGHQQVLSAFKMAAVNCKNHSIREFAVKTIPIIEKHLDSAKAINEINF